MKKFFKETFRFVGALLALARGVMIIGMVAVACMTIYLIYITGQVTLKQYNETLTWQDTAYAMSLSEIEPALVANRLDTDIVTAAEAWENLENYVDSLDVDNGINREEAEAILAEAVKWQEVYNLQSDDITRLQLYLKMDDAIEEAYITMDTTELQGLAQELYTLEMEEETTAGQKYMDKFRKVCSDFAEARSIITDMVGSVGSVENGVWTIPYTYGRNDLTDILEEIQKLKRFPELNNIADVLTDIADVLNYNKNAREYFEFREFMETVEDITRADYVAVSSIYTYEQALAFGCTVEPKYRDGYTVSKSSPITGIYYEGDRLANNQYVRRGTALTAEISEIYDPIYIPREEPVTQEIQSEELVIEQPPEEIVIIEEGAVESYE